MIEVLPVGVTCNLRCEYCYEQAARDVQPVSKYNREAVMQAIKTSQGFWQLFGGEPLLIRFEELEELLKAGYEKWGYTGLQTNATLITPKHIELFQKYRTQVGISMDGPGELNDSRWAGTLEATRNATAKSEWAVEEIARIARETGDRNIGPTMIVTLHAGNASEERWPRMKEWIRYLDSIGVSFINIHFMEMDYNAEKFYLPDEQITKVMVELWEMTEELKSLKFLNFEELIDLLRGKDSASMCVWKACDPWSTAAVQGLGNEGEPSNCTRGIKDGKDWLPSEGSGQESQWQITQFKTNRFHERQLSLYVTPEEDGGCKGCRFWLMCQGYCPGTGVPFDTKDGDWRLKSSHCATLKSQFEEVERRLVAVGDEPLSLSPQRPLIETIMYTTWERGGEIDVAHAIQIANESQGNWNRAYSKLVNVMQSESIRRNGVHGDHTDVAMLQFDLQQREQMTVEQHQQTGEHPGHADNYIDHTDASIPHIPHGDHTDLSVQTVPHGDHTDTFILDKSEDIPHGDHTDASFLNEPQNIPHGDHTDSAIVNRTEYIPHGDHTDLMIANQIQNIPHGDHIDAALLDAPKNIPHGDHTDTALLQTPVNIPHGDSHEDVEVVERSHGDHFDIGREESNITPRNWHGDIPHGDHTDLAKR